MPRPRITTLGRFALDVIRAGTSTGRLAVALGRAFPIVAKAAPIVGAAVVVKEIAEQVLPFTFDVVEGTAQVSQVLTKISGTKLSKVEAACKVLEDAFERTGKPPTSQALGFLAAGIVIAGCKTTRASRVGGRHLRRLIETERRWRVEGLPLPLPPETRR